MRILILGTLKKVLPPKLGNPHVSIDSEFRGYHSNPQAQGVVSEKPALTCGYGSLKLIFPREKPLHIHIEHPSMQKGLYSGMEGQWKLWAHIKHAPVPLISFYFTEETNQTGWTFESWGCGGGGVYCEHEGIPKPLDP